MNLESKERTHLTFHLPYIALATGLVVSFCAHIAVHNNHTHHPASAGCQAIKSWMMPAQLAMIHQASTNGAAGHVSGAATINVGPI